MLTTGLLIGSSSGAIALADPESTGSTSQGQGSEESSQSVTTPSASTTTVADTSKQPTTPNLLHDVIRKLQELGKPRQRPIVVTTPTTDRAATASKTDTKEPDANPADSEPSASDSNEAAADSDPADPLTNGGGSNSDPAPNPLPPSVKKVVQPMTHAVVAVAGAALSVPGVIVSLPSSTTPVADVITAVENLLISVYDAVVPLVQVPSDFYSLLVVVGMDAMPEAGTVGNSFGAGLSSAVPGVIVPPLAPIPPPLPPIPPAPGGPLLGHPTAPVTVAGIAAAGLRANLSLSGTAPMVANAPEPAGALSLLEHTVKAMLAPVSLSALAAFALPGVGGLLIICAAGVRLGYRQAKAALAVRTTGISRFARQGPLGVVRSGALVSVPSRRTRSLRMAPPEVAPAAPLLEQAA